MTAPLLWARSQRGGGEGRGSSDEGCRKSSSSLARASAVSQWFGQGAGQERVSDPAIPVGKGAGAVFLFQHLYLRVALEHPGVELVRPACVRLIGHDAVNRGDDCFHKLVPSFRSLPSAICSPRIAFCFLLFAFPPLLADLCSFEAQRVVHQFAAVALRGGRRRCPSRRPAAQGRSEQSRDFLVSQFGVPCQSLLMPKAGNCLRKVSRTWAGVCHGRTPRCPDETVE